MNMRLFEVHPKKPISGILPNNRRIMDVMRLPLNRAEFLKCMNFGTVYAIVGEDKVLVTEMDYGKALSLFDKHVEYSNKTVKLSDKVSTKGKFEIKHTEQKPVSDSIKVNIVKDETKSEDKAETKTFNTKSNDTVKPIKEETVVEHNKETNTEVNNSNGSKHISTSSKNK